MSAGTTRKIGDVAEATGLSIRTLRHYDDIGLVIPSGHTAGGFRLYADADIDRLLLVRRMKPLGFTLERMKDFIDAMETLRDSQRFDSGAADEVGAARATIDAIRAEADQRYSELKAKLEYAEEFLHLIEHVGK